MNTPIYETIMDEMLTTVEAIGIDKTIKALKEAKLNSLLLHDINIEFILKSVSDSTSVSVERILRGSDRNDERKMSIALVVYFMKNELYYSYSEIKKILNKDESALSRYNTMVDTMCNTKTKKTDFDNELYKHFKTIKLLITEKKITNGL